MEYFRRLLGALQETLDYVSIFTTYLLGDETHPGAEESGRTRELKQRSSRHNSEVETAAHSGDVSPQGYLATFERPLPTKVTSFNQEIHVAPEAVITGAQATEAIPEPLKSACKYEGQEVAGQKLSESPQFLADAPKPRPTATETGNDWQRDLEGLALIQGLQPWEPESATLREGIQQEGLEEIGLDTGSSPYWESDSPLTGGNREGEQNGGRGTDCTQQRELEGTDQQTDWALSVVEQPSELKGAAWTEYGSLKELATMAECQHLEEEKEEEEEESAAEWDQQRGTYEGTQQVVLERAEFEGNQEGVLEEVDIIHLQEPGKTLMTFEVQEWVAEEGNSHQSGLEGTKDTEDHQQRELEGPLRNETQAEDKRQEEQTDGVWEGTSERLVEEDPEEEVLEKTETRGVQLWESECTEKSLQEEATGSRASLDMYLFGGEQTVGEPEKLTEELEKVAALVVREEAEPVGHQQQESERTERSLQQQPTGSRASPDMCLYAGGEQIGGEPEKPEDVVEVVMLEDEDVVEVVMLEDEKTSGHWPWEPEGRERRLHEEPMGSRASLATCFFAGEQIVGEPEKLAEEQEAVDIVLEETETGGYQPWALEVTENSLHEEPMRSRASLDASFFDGEQTVQELEKSIEEVAVIMREEGETGGPQPWEPEVGLNEEPKGCNTSLNMCLLSGEQVFEKLTEEQEAAAVIVLEEAEIGGGEPWEPEGPERTLLEEHTESQASPDECLFAGPSTFPAEVLPLDTSAQKERVMLRRKSSIRRAPSLKKPKLPTETQLPLANLTEPVPSPLQATRQPNPRHSGFGPMHSNMMAELQMRLRQPQ